MLPRIHLGSLLTATNTQIVAQTKQQRQTTLERRASRNLEGFYIYQTYLRRLRRLHRAYVTRYKQAHPEASTVPPLPPPGTAQFYSLYSDEEGGFTPIRHRLTMSDMKTNSQERRVTFGEDSPAIATPPPTPTSSRAPVMWSDPNSIHIPCGRENSFHSPDSALSDRSITGSNSPRIHDVSFSSRKHNNVRGANNLDSGTLADRGGALPFRLWRQQQGRKGAGSIYSYATITEESPPVVPNRKMKADRLLHPKRVGLLVKQ